MLSWQPPLLSERNGVILNYTVLLRQSPSSEPRTVYSQATSTLLHPLAPKTTYFYSVAASTVAGTGPFSDYVQVTTPDEGNIDMHVVEA